MTRGIRQSSLLWLCSAAAAVTLTTCYSADHSDDTVDPAALALDLTPFERTADANGRGKDCPPRSALSALEIRVRTSKVGGRYAPRNVGAIWIEDTDGVFVKTLARWGRLRARWLQRFNMASMGDVTDAVSSATLAMHETHEITWDLSDVYGCEVADGDYVLLVEVTDRNTAGASIAVPFTKSQAGFSILADDAPSFHELSLTLR